VENEQITFPRKKPATEKLEKGLGKDCAMTRGEEEGSGTKLIRKTSGVSTFGTEADKN